MSEVASLELCKELYGLSGWELPSYNFARWVVYDDETVALWLGSKPGHFNEVIESFPAYDLGHLLRKLPVTQKYISPYKKNNRRPDQKLGVVYYLTVMTQHSTGGFMAGYLRFNRQTNGPVPYWWCGENKAYGKLVGIADSPEDSAAKLAIELFKQGILTKETH